MPVGGVMEMNNQQNQRKRYTGFPGTIALAVCILALLAFLFWENFAEAEPTMISLGTDAIDISGRGAAADGAIVTIVQGGRYRITGALEDGQIYVDCDGEKILLELAGVTLGNSSEAAIHIENAESATILLAEGTENFLRSGNANGSDDDKKGDGAVIYAEGDLLITGEGALKVAGMLNNGIQSKAGLRIDGGSIEVEAAGNAIKGKDDVTIEGGEFRLSAGKKGIQAKYELYITGGNFLIEESEEGLEANQIVIEGGIFDIAAGDDGINANGGEAKQEKNPSEDVVETMPNLIIRGGILHIDAEGDGLDSNGNLLIEGGELVIDGPTKDDNGPLDYGKENDGFCQIKGGMVLAVGSSGMAETFDEGSEQCSFRYLFDKSYEAGTEIVINDADGRELYRYKTAKPGASVVFSSSELALGETYTLRAGEFSTEIVQDSVSAGK